MVKKCRLTLVGAIFVVAGAHIAAANERHELRDQIERLEQRLRALEDDRARRTVVSAAAVESGTRPRTWKLPGTNTSLRVGGYAKLDLIYDINGAAGDSFAIAGLPVDGSAAGRQQGHFRLHARQTRLFIRTWTPTDWGELATHIEGDFFGGGGTETASNSSAFRLRHAYARLGPVLAGQFWSAFMVLDALPSTIDFTGPAGQVFVRQAQVRYVHSFGGGTTVGLSIENPETARAVAPGGLAAAGALSPNDPLPDIIVLLRHKWSSGAAKIAGLVRYLGLNDGGSAGISDSAIGWGVHAGFRWSFNRGRTTIGGSVFGGQGLGRYIVSFPAEVVLNGTSSTNADAEAVTTIGGFVWLMQRWTRSLRSTFVYGRSYADVAGANSTGAGGKTGLGAIGQDVWTVHANLVWQPVAQVDIGVEYIYGFNGVINSANAKAHRIQVGMLYRF